MKTRVRESASAESLTRTGWALRLLGACMLTATSAVACASSVERSTRRDFRAIEAQLADLPDAQADVDTATQTPDFDGRLSGYLSYAFANSPELRASFEQWRAATHGPRQERRLPDPELTFGVFVRPMETPMGPMRAQLSVMQMFPWPTKITAGSKAAAHEAEAAQRVFEAQALEVAAEVARPYWRLWHLERLREVEEQDIEILAGLSEQIRARVEVGGAQLSELAQVDLRLVQARDRLAELDQEERALSAELVRAVGAPLGTPTPVQTDPPVVIEPAETIQELARVAAEHPRVASMAAMSAASSERARAARADRFPRFGLGAEWVIVGRSGVTPPPHHDGRDSVMLMGTVSVPLWQRSYGAAVEEAKANEAAYRARALSARNQVMAETQAGLARVESDVRRVRLYEHSLVPQAEAALESVISSYAVGRASIAEVLMAERELLEARHAIVEVQVDYAIDWVELERIVGRPVATKEVDRGSD